MHGKGLDKYDNVRIGLNSRLDTIQAAVLLEKIEALPSELQRRSEIAQLYDKGLSGICQTPLVPHGYSSAWAQYTIRSGRRDRFIDILRGNDIPAFIYYGKCMHQQSAFSYLDFADTDFETAENAASQVVSLPMHPYLHDEEVSDIVSLLASQAVDSEV